MVEAVANVVLNFGLGCLFGITGVLVATVVTIFFFNYLQRNAALFRCYFKGEPIGEFYRQQFYYFFAAVLTVTATMAACRFVTSDYTVASLAARAAVCLILPPALLLLMYRPCSRWESARAFVAGMAGRLRGGA